jgi:hypothetical protein
MSQNSTTLQREDVKDSTVMGSQACFVITQAVPSGSWS